MASDVLRGALGTIDRTNLQVVRQRRDIASQGREIAHDGSEVGARFAERMDLCGGAHRAVLL
jgi:hypothetical protein